MPRNPLGCSFGLFSIIWVMPFIYKLESLRDLTVFIRLFVSSFGIISIVLPEQKVPEVPDPKMFFWIPAFETDAAFSLDRISTLLTNSITICKALTNGNPAFINGPESLSRNPPYWIILDRYVLHNFIFPDELFAKTFLRLKTFLSLQSVNSKLSHTFLASV